MNKPSRECTPPTLYGPNCLQYTSLKNIILFAHAFSGCDTTSAFFNQGKNNFFQILNNNPQLREDAEVFNLPNANRGTLFEIACSMVLRLYAKNKQTMLKN